MVLISPGSDFLRLRLSAMKGMAIISAATRDTTPKMAMRTDSEIEIIIFSLLESTTVIFDCHGDKSGVAYFLQSHGSAIEINFSYITLELYPHVSTLF
jgi:hypothetical protein